MWSRGSVLRHHNGEGTLLGKPRFDDRGHDVGNATFTKPP